MELKKEGLSYIFRSCKVCTPHQTCNYDEQMKVDEIDGECTTNTWGEKINIYVVVGGRLEGKRLLEGLGTDGRTEQY